MRTQALVFATTAAFLLCQIRTLPQRIEPHPNPHKTLFTLSQVWGLDAVYIDRQHGVTFRYSSIWRPGIAFGYWPPALTLSDQAKPIAGFAYQDGFNQNEVTGPYSGTNMEGVGIVYSAVPATSVRGCDAMAANISGAQDQSLVALGGRSFTVHETSSAGMSQSFSGKLYATYARSTCYLFETGVALGPPPDVASLRWPTPSQRHSIETHLFAIMKSVRIALTGQPD
jgi:hypothetical protein